MDYLKDKMEKKFEFKEVDVEGWETLSAIESADKLNNWMYQTIQPYCTGKILEIGSGIGNISQFFIKNNQDITLSDIRDNYCNELKKKFPKATVLNLDLVDKDFDGKMKEHLEQYDTIFALNVVEHIENDYLALENARKLLKKGGNLIILVPAYQWLYNGFDTELEHYRRYTAQTLQERFTKNHFSILKSKYFNFAGIAGWYVSGKLQKNKTLPKDQVKLYNILVPVFKLIDKLIFNSMGLSVIVVGKK
ncbi:MAG: class I SAM-dependent methyltransferase [Raineya sp.]|jgi:2-polyprenyl-3-methyl-5-hydroxy-6-metoxy-1,4-benzoquinol methylase|nr:class I SAM-dependent methyltransferase [Raineya sp.]